MKTKLSIVGFMAAAAAALLLAACAGGGVSEDDLDAVRGDLDAVQGEVEALSGGLSIAPVERFIEVTGFELKGTTNTDDLAAPDVDPSTLSDGFGFKPPGNDPDNPKNWTVESYVWRPGNMTAFQGDKINLHFFIINGNEHEVWIEGPDGSTVVDETEMNRGREYTFTFDASQGGVYRLICNNHEPTMTAEIVVLPRP